MNNMDTQTPQEVEQVFSGQLSVVRLGLTSLAITTPDDYQKVAGLKIEAKRVRKTAEAYFRPDIDKAHQLHGSLLSKLKQFTDAADLLDQQATSAMRKWDQEQEDIRRKAEIELQRNLDADRRQAEQEAASLLAKGMIRDATQKQAAADAIPQSVSLPSTVPQVKGIAKVQRWTAEVTDMAALVKAVAEGKVPLYHEIPVRGFMKKVCVFDPNAVLMGHYATSLQDNFRWPGVKVGRGASYSTRT